GAQSFPQLLVDAERQYGARFMEAGVIIELRYLVQAEDHVVPRTDPFTRVDCARFQGSRDFSSRKIDDDGAESPQDLAAQTRHAEPRAGVPSSARAPLRDPPPNLRAGVRTQRGLDVDPAAQLVPQFLPAAPMNPGSHFVGGEAKRHRGKEIETRGPLLPVILSGMIHVRDAARAGIEHLEGAAKLSPTENLDFKAPFGINPHHAAY